MTRNALIAASLSVCMALLAACESAEERAEAHFQKGMALLDEGDVDRALVELRNVFKLNGRHKQARLAYARTEQKLGNVGEAYGQYLRLVEQYPDNLPARRALAVQAAKSGNWKEAERHGKRAEKLAPEDPLVRSVAVSLDYRAAITDDDPDARKKAVATASALIEKRPELSLARRVVIDDRLRAQDWKAALKLIDAGLEETPDARELYELRLGVLERLGRTDAIENQLRDLVSRFPDQKGMHRRLVQWYIGQGRLDAAEKYLRGRIESGTDNVEARSELVEFLRATRGRDAAKAELDRIIEAGSGNQALFRSIRAGLIFESGDREAAIADLRALLKDAEPSEQTRRIKIALARMLFATGNTVGGRSLVEEALKADPTNVAALKLKAGWLIEDDRTGDAIASLRSALDQSPEDPEIMTLMAEAHKRDGNRRLMGEMLSLAVEKSGNAPQESLRYAAFLREQDSLRTAEEVLNDALRLHPQHIALLSALGTNYVSQQDWTRADSVLDRLKKIDTSQARAAANTLEARKLARQNRAEDLRAFLGDLQESGSGGVQADAGIVRVHLAQNEVEAALDYARKRVEEEPDNPALRFILGSVQAVDGQFQTAEKTFRRILSERPENEQVWVALYRLQIAQGEAEAAENVLEEALAAVPEGPNLLWAKASRLERNGNTEAAIAIYEDLYARESSSFAVANNLASLISSTHDDPESLQRAFRIARRLRNSDQPAFQDTYGWIAFQLGNHQEALDYLEQASEGLPGDAAVQFHLAKAYEALGRTEAALSRYRDVAEMVSGQDNPPPFLATVKDAITSLSGAGQDGSGAPVDAAAEQSN